MNKKSLEEQKNEKVTQMDKLLNDVKAEERAFTVETDCGDTSGFFWQYSNIKLVFSYK